MLGSLGGLLNPEFEAPALPALCDYHRSCSLQERRASCCCSVRCHGTSSIDRPSAAMPSQCFGQRWRKGTLRTQDTLILLFTAACGAPRQYGALSRTKDGVPNQVHDNLCGEFRFFIQAFGVVPLRRSTRHFLLGCGSKSCGASVYTPARHSLQLQSTSYSPLVWAPNSGTSKAHGNNTMSHLQNRGP